MRDDNIYSKIPELHAELVSSEARCWVLEYLYYTHFTNLGIQITTSRALCSAIWHNPSTFRSYRFVTAKLDAKFGEGKPVAAGEEWTLPPFCSQNCSIWSAVDCHLCACVTLGLRQWMQIAMGALSSSTSAISWWTVFIVWRACGHLSQALTHHALPRPDFTAFVMISAAVAVLHHRSGMEFIHRYYWSWGNNMVVMKHEIKQNYFGRMQFLCLLCPWEYLI